MAKAKQTKKITLKANGERLKAFYRSRKGRALAATALDLKGNALADLLGTSHHGDKYSVLK